MPDAPLYGRLHCANLFETICRADARCQHQSEGRQWRRHTYAAVLRYREVILCTLSRSVRTFVHVPAASWRLTGNVRIKVTMRHFRVTLLTVEEQKYYIFCMCVYVCVRVCVAFAPYCIVCGLSGSATFSHIISLYVISVCKRVTLPPGLHPIAVKYIFHSFISGTILGERLSNIKCVFWFSLQNFRLYIVILRRIQRDIVMNICRA